MSGGVDSSVCAYLLKQQGYDVIGTTMRLWEDEEEACTRAGHVGCCGQSAVEDAMRICAGLGIPFHVFSLQETFRREVVDYFCRSYLSAETPNPCIACNRFLKWQALREKAAQLGADFIATGHYARIHRTAEGRYAIGRSKDARKDQSYVLYPLTQDDLAHTLLPLGDYEKEQVRAIAAEAGLPVANKPDSQDICFVPDGDYAAFLERQVGAELVNRPGSFVMDGRTVGQHKGIVHYTIGQRKGLGLSLGRPVFVNQVRADTNEVVLGDEEKCFADALVAEDVIMQSVAGFDAEATYVGRIRYSDRGTPCRVRQMEDGKIKVCFLEPVRAITPGQAVVIDDGTLVVGGGRILGSCLPGEESSESFGRAHI
ncbi:MAG: tRNA 2-thiouridine(34) synthase MnmA [Lachnospiraceae bacterium]|nr:tRNA 2-thiouridine(34) synthase MnmA [Lachnospiraceae bacterium]